MLQRNILSLSQEYCSKRVQMYVVLPRKSIIMNCNCIKCLLNCDVSENMNKSFFCAENLDSVDIPHNVNLNFQ